jgi:hypothetical protein
MQSIQSEVTTFFRQSGYDICPQVATNPELLFFESGFAGIGVFLAQTAEDAFNSWPDLQAAVANARTLRPRGRLKDWYLVFIVPEVRDEDGPGIQDIINDTHVCRKIVLEKKERPLPEVLSEIPFFRLHRDPMIAPSVLPEDAVELSRPGLPANLLVDLAKRSPKEIIKRSLKGKYKSGANHDEA